MTRQFEYPIFEDGRLEFRIDDEGIAIYGIRDGLMAMAKICTKLASRSFGIDRTAHVHLEDQGLLTSKSVIAVVACFEA